MAQTNPSEAGGLRVVVTGATGNVGTALIRALEGDPAVGSVVGLARRLPAEGAGDRRPPPTAKTTYRAVDVAQDDLAGALAGADVLVHLAWLFQPTHQPMVTWQANAVGSVRVFEAATRAGVRAIVYSSSVGAYSPRSAAGQAVDESWPTHSTPTAAYGREKAYVERVLDTVEARHPDVRVVRFRPGFMFQRSSGTQQRRLFAGPLIPRPLLRPGRLPLLPVPAGLQFHALHTDDAARAFQAAVTGDARGAFNIAAEPAIDAARLGEILGAKPVTAPRALVRGVVAGGWHLRMVPADPALLDLFLSLPLLDTARARRELAWEPAVSGPDALRQALTGMAEGVGGDTAPLAPDSVRGRAREVATGVGGTAS